MPHTLCRTVASPHRYSSRCGGPLRRTAAASERGNDSRRLHPAPLLLVQRRADRQVLRWLPAPHGRERRLRTALLVSLRARAQSSSGNPPHPARNDLRRTAERRPTLSDPSRDWFFLDPEDEADLLAAVENAPQPWIRFPCDHCGGLGLRRRGVLAYRIRRGQRLLYCSQSCANRAVFACVSCGMPPGRGNVRTINGERWCAKCAECELPPDVQNATAAR